jgi:hypothetical protein
LGHFLLPVIVEEIMVAALKILVLPSLFILPWLWMKAGNGETFVRELLASQPVLAGLALVPGAFLFIVWILKLLKS